MERRKRYRNVGLALAVFVIGATVWAWAPLCLVLIWIAGGAWVESGRSPDA